MDMAITAALDIHSVGDQHAEQRSCIHRKLASDVLLRIKIDTLISRPDSGRNRFPQSGNLDHCLTIRYLSRELILDLN